MRDVDVVVLSRFPEIFEGFRESVDRDVPEIRKVVIWDQDSKNIPPLYHPWWSVQDSKPFQMARSGNTLLKATFSSDTEFGDYRHDILYCGDDTRIIEPNTIQRLQEAAYSDPSIGIISPQIVGLCAAEVLKDDGPIAELSFVGFVFVYIKREVIEKVGYLDERFEGYGTEDIDYCYRARLAGFKIGMAKTISVKHGVNGKGYGSTFIRTTGEPEMAKQDAANRKRFAEKWGLDPNDERGIFEAIRTLSAAVSR